MKNLLKELFPIFTGIAFWIIYLGIIYLVLKDKVILLMLGILLLASIFAFLAIIAGQKIVDFVKRMNNSLQNEDPKQFNASIKIKMWSLEHPPWI